MIAEYVQATLERARYELINDSEPYYGEVPEVAGVWASGPTLEECRHNLADVLDGWIVLRRGRGIPIPPLGNHTISGLESIEVNA